MTVNHTVHIKRCPCPACVLERASQQTEGLDLDRIRRLWDETRLIGPHDAAKLFAEVERLQAADVRNAALLAESVRLTESAESDLARFRAERVPPPNAQQFIRYAPESVIDALDAETPRYRERMDTLMAGR